MEDSTIATVRDLLQGFRTDLLQEVRSMVDESKTLKGRKPQEVLVLPEKSLKDRVIRHLMANPYHFHTHQALADAYGKGDGLERGKEISRVLNTIEEEEALGKGFSVVDFSPRKVYRFVREVAVEGRTRLRTERGIVYGHSVEKVFAAVPEGFKPLGRREVR